MTTARKGREAGGNRRSEALKLLFTPLRIGNIELKNRIIMPPMVDRLAMGGTVTEAVKDFYGARARGGVGMIVLTPGIVDVSMASDIQLGVWEDRFIPKLKELTDVVHAAGALMGIELMHLGRQGGGIAGYESVAPSPIPWSPHEAVPRELSTAEVEALVEKFADASVRVREAGFDLVELHACHGYLLSGFLSPHTNKRTDKYGGDLPGRARFVVEIVKRIKEKAGRDFPISCRINGADYMPGGVNLEMARETARMLVEAGADTIGVSAGAYGSYPVIVPPYDQPKGSNVYLSEGVKEVVAVPVSVAGRLNDPWLADEVLVSGKADMIAIARGLLADPDLPNKWLNGRFEDVRTCIACNVCIDQEGTEPIACTVNPEAGREREMELAPAPEAKKVMVIGAGLAGLETARVAAARGHTVHLYEEDEEAGGQWVLAARPPHKEDHLVFLRYLERQVEKLGTDWHPGERATADTVRALAPDTVIVATGGQSAAPPVPGIDTEGVVSAWDVLGGVEVGGRVMVVGGGSTGLETAEYLAARGKEVVVVELLRRVGADMGGTVRHHLMNRLKGSKVQVFTSTAIRRIEPGCRVVVLRGDEEETWDGFDAIVLACGVKPRSEIVPELQEVARELYIIGDAAKARRGLEAIREGAEVGRKV